MRRSDYQTSLESLGIRLEGSRCDFWIQYVVRVANPADSEPERDKKWLLISDNVVIDTLFEFLSR